MVTFATANIASFNNKHEEGRLVIFHKVALLLVFKGDNGVDKSKSQDEKSFSFYHNRCLADGCLRPFS